MAPRKPKAPTNEFLAAVQFVGSVLKEHGSPNETHAIIFNGWIVAFNGIVSAGTRTNTNFYCAPNSTLLGVALAKCKEEYSLEFKDNVLKISSGKFKANVPCMDPSLINTAGIDPPAYNINDEFKKGLELTGALATDNGQTIHSASILMNGQSLISTENGVVLFEYWHGCELPGGIAIPKALVAPLTKTTKKLVKMGASNSSVTFYFEDESWIKSQLFSEKWPNLDHILNHECNPKPIPNDLWEGLNAVAPHSVDNLVYFDSNLIRSHPSDSLGATYDVAGLPKGPIFNIKQLSFIKDHAKQIDFFVKEGQMTYFFGERCRGVIAGRMQR